MSHLRSRCLAIQVEPPGRGPSFGLATLARHCDGRRTTRTPGTPRGRTDAAGDGSPRRCQQADRRTHRGWHPSDVGDHPRPPARRRRQADAGGAALDDDVRRAIAERRAGKGPTVSEVVDLIGSLTLYGSQRSILEIPHRFEGLAAAQLLGSPNPVDDIELAPRRPCDVVVDGEGTRRRLRASSDSGGALAEVGVRVVEPGRVERRISVETKCGTVTVKPLDEIQPGDGWSARVLQILRDETRGECA